MRTRWMTRGLHQLLVCLSVLTVACGSGGGGSGDGAAASETPAENLTPTVVLETSRGRIVMELDREKAPESVANFLRHVNSGFYDGLVFHRVKPNFMIQAGVLTADMQRRVSTVFPVANEADNGLENVRGAVAMARTSDPHSATSEFFINLIDNPGLDFREQTPRGWGYAVFGRVVEGMEVVDAVAAIPTTRRGRYADLPVEATVIDSGYVASTP